MGTLFANNLATLETYIHFCRILGGYSSWYYVVLVLFQNACIDYMHHVFQ